eukprot:scaffold7766_cov48-Attheya_sp.AAC.2
MNDLLRCLVSLYAARSFIVYLLCSAGIRDDHCAAGRGAIAVVPKAWISIARCGVAAGARRLCGAGAIDGDELVYRKTISDGGR